MAWKFRRRVKIIPGVHLNFSKSGISTSIGVKGASVTLGSSGAYLNTSIPGLGIYNRQQLSNGVKKPMLPPALPQNNSYPFESRGNIFSADIHEITSQDMQGIKEAILLARQQRATLHSDLSGIQKALHTTQLKKTLSYLLLYGLFKKSIPARLSNDIEAQQEAIIQTKDQIDASFVKLKAHFDPDIEEKYKSLVTAFTTLSRSSKIWDLTSSHYEDRVVTRSSASTVVTRRKVSLGLKSISEFKSEVHGLYFQNANGADLYIYPSFIIMYSNKSDFAIIGLDEVDFQYSYVRFVETENVPVDSKVIDRTWAKVNKNGTPDRRFKGNYQIPVVRYGEIRLKTKTGLHEVYKFSNYESTEAFGKAYKDYRESVLGFDSSRNF